MCGDGGLFVDESKVVLAGSGSMGLLMAREHDFFLGEDCEVGFLVTESVCWSLPCKVPRSRRRGFAPGVAGVGQIQTVLPRGPTAGDSWTIPSAVELKFLVPFEGVNCAQHQLQPSSFSSSCSTNSPSGILWAPAGFSLGPAAILCRIAKERDGQFYATLTTTLNWASSLARGSSPKCDLEAELGS